MNGVLLLPAAQRAAGWTEVDATGVRACSGIDR